MTTKKKHPRTSSHAEKKTAGDSHLKSSAEHSGPLVGIIGWNSPKFQSTHSAFLEALKSAVSAFGGRAAFLGVSGGSDASAPAADGNGKPSKSGEENGACAAPSLSSHYGLPSRDIVADQIEMIVHEERLDALLMVPWSVNSLVGMLMAGARCGVPVLFAPHYRSWPQLRTDPAGKDAGPLCYSHCSMPLLLEVLGMTRIGTLEQIFKTAGKKPARSAGNSPAVVAPLAQSMAGGPEDTQFHELAEWAGRRIVEIARQKISPRRFFTEASLHNAVCADIALGGSAESVLHLGAVACEAGVPLPLTIFNETSKRMVQLVQLNKTGEYSLEEFEKSGGLNSLLGALHGFLQPSPTVMGKNIAEIAKENSALRSPFKAGLHAQRKPGTGLAVLFGNLAQEGALFRASGLKESWMAGSGPARVFSSEDAAVEAVRAKKVKKGEVVVVRYCGPRGRPGMPPLWALPRALEDAGLDDAVMLLTDGRLGYPGPLPAIVHVSREAAVGSPLSIVHDGDMIFWNHNDKSLTLRLTETEIKVRLSRWKEQDKNMRNSFLYRYAKYSSSSALGAILA